MEKKLSILKLKLKTPITQISHEIDFDSIKLDKKEEVINPKGRWGIAIKPASVKGFQRLMRWWTGNLPFRQAIDGITRVKLVDDFGFEDRREETRRRLYNV